MGEDSVIIRDVMLRDGLQNIPEFVPTEAKIELFKKIVASGIKEVEVTSFVNPKAVPQFKDAAEVTKEVLRIKPDDVEICALVPNLKGAQNALKSGMRTLDFVMSVSESHNISNVRRTTAESLEEFKKILELKREYPGAKFSVGLATVFGCPFEGKIKPEVTIGFVRKYYEMGVRDISLADTVGYGNPKEVREVVRLCLREFPDVKFGLHLHDTRGLGLANALAAYEEGVRIFDGAVGGLGGCPFAPGASGNISTEDMVFMFEEMGVKTGVDLAALFEVSKYFKSVKGDVRFTSDLLKAGVPAPRGPITKEEGKEQKWFNK